MKADAIQRGLQVERSVDDTASEITALRQSNNIQVVGRVGEGLLADFLGTMDEGDARFLNT